MTRMNLESAARFEAKKYAATTLAEDKEAVAHDYEMGFVAGHAFESYRHAEGCALGLDGQNSVPADEPFCKCNKHFGLPEKDYLMTCEFCNEPAEFTEYTKPFKLLGGGWRTDGTWPTCPTCHAMIANNERGALLARTVNANLHVTGLPISKAREGFAIMLDGFWENKL
jgi:hypothetical protein